MACSSFGSQDINFVKFQFWILSPFRPGSLNKNVIITWPALGLMGISGPSGVLMLRPTALGQHQNSRGARNTHDPTGWPCNNVSFSSIFLLIHNITFLWVTHGLTRNKSVLRCLSFHLLSNVWNKLCLIGNKSIVNWAAKLEPNSSQLTGYFFSLVWCANYFYPTTAKLHPRPRLKTRGILTKSLGKIPCVLFLGIPPCFSTLLLSDVVILAQFWLKAAHKHYKFTTHGQSHWEPSFVKGSAMINKDYNIYLATSRTVSCGCTL